MPTVDRFYGLVGSVAIKAPCRVATTANVTLNGALTVGSVALVQGDRVFVGMNQTNGVDRGIWIVNLLGAWTRSPDFDGPYDITHGTLVPVYLDSSGAEVSRYYKLTTDAPTIGATSLTFVVENLDSTQLSSDLEASTGSGLVGYGTQTVQGVLDVVAQTFTSVATLRANANSRTTVANTSGYYAVSDGGAASYYKDSSDTTTADDGFLCIVDAGSRRWKLNRPAGFINVLWAGAKSDGVTDDVTAFTKAVAPGVPVFVPLTTSFYNLSVLSAPTKALLYGSGVIKIAGAIIPIQTVPPVNRTDTSALYLYRTALAPAANTGISSYGRGAINTEVVRTGGGSQYGNWLNQYLVTAACGAGEGDTATTAWVSSTNFTAVGANNMGAWFGANTPSSYLSQAYVGGNSIGLEVNVGNRWADFGLLTDIGATRYAVGVQIVPDPVPALDGDWATTSCTISVASPAVVTLNSHGFTVNQTVVFGGAGTLPTGLVAGTKYFVISAGLAANTFQIAATPGGAAINTTGTFAAPVTIQPAYPSSFGTVLAASIHGHRWWVGNFVRANCIMPGGYTNLDVGGSIAGFAPAAHTKIFSNFVDGIDFSGGVFSGAALRFSLTDQTSATANAGGIVPPASVQGYIKVSIDGTIVKIPYFNN